MNKQKILVPSILAVIALTMVLAPTLVATPVYAGNNGDDDNDNNNGDSKLSDEEQAFQQGQQFGKQQAQQEQQQQQQSSAQQQQSAQQDQSKKPNPERVKDCKVQAQVKVLNVVNGSVYTVQLGSLNAQGKLANGTDDLAFNFQYKKSTGQNVVCPEKGATEVGTVSSDAGSEQFAVFISSLTKKIKIAIDPLFDDAAQAQALQQQSEQ